MLCKRSVRNMESGSNKKVLSPDRLEELYTRLEVAEPYDDSVEYIFDYEYSDEENARWDACIAQQILQENGYPLARKEWEETRKK